MCSQPFTDTTTYQKGNKGTVQKKRQNSKAASPFYVSSSRARPHLTSKLSWLLIRVFFKIIHQRFREEKLMHGCSSSPPASGCQIDLHQRKPALRRPNKFHSSFLPSMEAFLGPVWSLNYIYIWTDMERNQFTKEINNLTIKSNFYR